MTLIDMSAITSEMRVGGYTVDRAVVAHIKEASVLTGVSFEYLLAKAGQESSFLTNAKSTMSSATGIYQFTESTWLQQFKLHGHKYGHAKLAEKIEVNSRGGFYVKNLRNRQIILNLRKDPRTSAMLAAEFARSNQRVLENALGKSIKASDLYLAHFLGPRGAVNLLKAIEKDANQPAFYIFYDAAEANPRIFYKPNGSPRTVREVHNFLKKIFEQSIRKFTNLPPSFFASLPKVLPVGSVGEPSIYGPSMTPLAAPAKPNSETRIFANRKETKKNDGAFNLDEDNIISSNSYPNPKIPVHVAARMIKGTDYKYVANEKDKLHIESSFLRTLLMREKAKDASEIKHKNQDEENVALIKSPDETHKKSKQNIKASYSNEIKILPKNYNIIGPSVSIVSLYANSPPPLFREGKASSTNDLTITASRKDSLENHTFISSSIHEEWERMTSNTKSEGDTNQDFTLFTKENDTYQNIDNHDSFDRYFEKYKGIIDGKLSYNIATISYLETIEASSISNKISKKTFAAIDALESENNFYSKPDDTLSNFKIAYSDVKAIADLEEDSANYNDNTISLFDIAAMNSFEADETKVLYTSSDFEKTPVAKIEDNKEYINKVMAKAAESFVWSLVPVSVSYENQTSNNPIKASETY